MELVRRGAKSAGRAPTGGLTDWIKVTAWILASVAPWAVILFAVFAVAARVR